VSRYATRRDRLPKGLQDRHVVFITGRSYTPPRHRARHSSSIAQIIPAPPTIIIWSWRAADIGDDFEQLLDSPAYNGCDDRELGKARSDRIDDGHLGHAAASATARAGATRQATGRPPVWLAEGDVLVWTRSAG
jgi:hypothetical protein